MDAAQIAAMIADREAGTPGPWVSDGPSWNKIVWSDNENRIAFLAHSNGLNDDRDKANARRIARLPALEAWIIAQAAELERMRAAAQSVWHQWGMPEYSGRYAELGRRIAALGEALKGGTE